MNAARRRRQQQALPYLLLAPSLVLLAGMLYPFGLGLYYSFHPAIGGSRAKRFPFSFVNIDGYLGLAE